MSNPHRIHEIRSLEIHKIVAEKLRETPEFVIQHARNNITRWKTNGADCYALTEWEDILNKGPEYTLSVLLDTGENATRLRQSSPFPGLITQTQRKEIFQRNPLFGKSVDKT
jgi:hypothetical protein